MLDRLYADYSVIAWAVKEGREVVIRFPRNRFTVVNPFWAADAQERIVTLTVPPRPGSLSKPTACPGKCRCG